jgi:phage protein U
MFAVFGEISLEVLGSPDEFESNRSWDYAEHRVVESRPTLQWIADDLEVIELNFHFHISFSDPTAQMNALVAAANDHAARPLVFGNGSHRGYFILTSLRTSSRQMSATGALLAITVRAVLKEWAEGFSSISTANPVALFPLIGVVAAPAGSSTGSLTFTGAANQGNLSSPPSTEYVPTPIASPGVSPLLSIPGVVGLPTPHLTVGDIDPSTIVRAAR